MFPSLSKAFRSAPLELGNVPMIEAQSGAERRGNNEYLEKLQCSALLRWNWECTNDWGTERKQNETERNRMKQNETEWNGLKWIEMEQIRTNTHGQIHLWTERNGAEREEEIEKKVFYIITCTNGAERNGEWNGMEWNGMKQNETERNRMKQNETERNRMKQNEMDWNGTNQNKHTRTVPLWTERSGAEREEEIEISIS